MEKEISGLCTAFRSLRNELHSRKDGGIDSVGQEESDASNRASACSCSRKACEISNNVDSRKSVGRGKIDKMSAEVIDSNPYRSSSVLVLFVRNSPRVFPLVVLWL